MGKKTLPVQQLIDFQVRDDCIITKGQPVYFYRFTPPNTSILTDDELLDEILNYANLLDVMRERLAVFITDKIEDLSKVRDFYTSLSPKFEFATSEIIKNLDSCEVESMTVQRAFYFVYKPDKQGHDIYNHLVGNRYQVDRPAKHELAVLMRNYLVREFVNVDIYTIENDVKVMPKLKKAKQVYIDREIQRRLSPHRIDFGIFHAEQSGCLRKTIMLKNFPSDIPPAALKAVASLRGTTFTMRMEPMDKGKARKLTDQQIKNRKALSTQRDVTRRIDAELEEDSIIRFYREIAQSQNAIYNLSVYIEMYGSTKEKLRDVQDRVAAELAGLAITYEELKYEQRQGFLSVQPLGSDCFLADANNMPSKTAAALFPFSSSSLHHAQGMPLGRTVEGGSIEVDMWQWNSHITNGNIDIIGFPGMGKSQLLKKIVMFQHMRETACYILDPENEYIDLIRGLGGTVISFTDGRTIINPFEVRRLKSRDELKEDGAADELDELRIDPDMPMFFQHLSWLEDFFMVLFPKLSTAAVKSLMIIVQDVYKQKGITGKTNFSVLRPNNYPTFTDLYTYLDALTTRGHSEYQKLMNDDILQEIRRNIKSCYDGSLAPIFNGHTNIPNADLVCFSLLDLMEGSKERSQAVLFNITTYVWNIISRREKRVLFGIDELYLFLENMVMVKYLRSFSKRARKYSASLAICTQQLADCMAPELVTYTSAILNNAAFKFLFHPGEIDLAMVKSHLKLTDGEIKCISKPNKRHCLMAAGQDRYYIRVGYFEYEGALFGKAGGM